MCAPRTNFTTKAQAVAEVVRLRRLLAESEQETAVARMALQRIAGHEERSDRRRPGAVRGAHRRRRAGALAPILAPYARGLLSQ